MSLQNLTGKSILCHPSGRQVTHVTLPIRGEINHLTQFIIFSEICFHYMVSNKPRTEMVTSRTQIISPLSPETPLRFHFKNHFEFKQLSETFHQMAQ